MWVKSCMEGLDVLCMGKHRQNNLWVCVQVLYGGSSQKGTNCMGNNHKKEQIVWGIKNEKLIRLVLKRNVYELFVFN